MLGECTAYVRGRMEFPIRAFRRPASLVHRFHDRRCLRLFFFDRSRDGLAQLRVGVGAKLGEFSFKIYGSIRDRFRFCGRPRGRGRDLRGLARFFSLAHDFRAKCGDAIRRRRHGAELWRRARHAARTTLGIS